MKNKYREIEYKWVSPDNFHRTYLNLLDIFKDEAYAVTRGGGDDYFFKSETGDFFRVRFGFPNGKAQFTYKHTDKEIHNRREINVMVEDGEAGLRLARQMFGEELLKIYKTYVIIFFNEKENIVVYEVRGRDEVFVEVEAMNMGRLNEISKKIKNVVGDRVYRSLFELCSEGM